MQDVSIIIPTYNRASVLQRAIDSVFRQTHQEFELVIVDDGSTDETEEVVDQYNDNRIKYIKHDNNRGQNVARNTGLDHASGTYISYLDSDDLLLESHLKRVVQKFEELPSEYGGIITASEDIASGEQKKTQVYEGEFTYDDVITDLYKNIGGLSLLTFKSEVLSETGKHDTSVVKHTDLDFYLQILKRYRMYGMNSVLVRRYKQEDSVSYDTEKIINGDKYILEKYEGGLSNTQKSNFHHNIGIAHMANGDTRAAIRQFISCIRNNPSQWYYYHHLILSLLGHNIFDYMTPNTNLDKYS